MAEKTPEARLKELEFENLKLTELNRSLYEWRRRMTLLLEFSNKAAEARSLDKLLSFLMEGTRQILQADRCTIFLLDEKKRELWSKAAQDSSETIRFPAHAGLAGHVARTGETVTIRDVRQDPRFNPDVDRKTGYQTRTLLSVPMRNTSGAITGVFQVLNKKEGFFDELDAEILGLIAARAAGAVENVQLADELRRSTLETILSLSLAAEYRDQEDTATHLKRMSEYSAIIAREMGWKEDAVEDVRCASPMHDVGKIGIPDAILLKPGKLTPEEREIMQHHTVIGSKILGDSDSALLRMSREIALSHHEKFDGSGYPYGLAGERIPLVGRIVALADVFDALTSKRVYKEAWSLEETLSRVREDSGKHFDPKVVDAFFKGLEDCKKVMEKYKTAVKAE